jgi:hypothetical protein
MANEMPSPEKIMAAFTSFPPKLSEVQSLFSMPEDMFENTARSAGLEVPPGPNKMITSMMSSFEEMFAGGGAPAFLPLPFTRSGGRTESVSYVTPSTSELTAVNRTETEEVARPRRFELR